MTQQNSGTTSRLDPSATGSKGMALAVAATGLLSVSAQWPGLVNRYVVNDDVRQQLFWMRRWIEPQLYPPDILNEYARSYVPWGVQGLYRLGALACDPLYFSKFVAIALLTLLGTLVFLSARRILNEAFAWLALALFWLMPAFLGNISGGLARAFAAPLLALFLYAHLADSRRLAHVSLWGQALFIPYILPISLLASGLHFAAWKLGAVRSRPLLRSPLDAVSAAGALATVMYWQHGMNAAGFGPLPWGADMADKPEFGSAGRYPMLPVRSVFWELFGRPWSVLAPFRELGLAGGIVCSALLLPLLGLGLWRLDWSALRVRSAGPALVMLASLLLFFTAKALLLKLFIPSRHLEHTTNLFYCLAVPLLLSPLALPALRRWPRPALLALASAALLVGAVRQHGFELYNYSAERPLYETALRTPAGSLFAGHPDQMDRLITFGHRNAYATYELAHPWSVGYWRTIGPRLERLMRAYYSADPEEVRSFCAEAGIDFLVVDRRHFDREYMAKGPLFEPFSGAIRRRAQEPAPFALVSGAFPGEAVDTDITVVDMRQQRAEADRP